MKTAAAITLMLALSSCAFQGPSLAFRPFDTASESDLEAQTQAIERAFKVVDARLKALETPKDEATQ